MGEFSKQTFIKRTLVPEGATCVIQKPRKIADKAPKKEP